MATAYDWRPSGSALPILPGVPTVLNGALPQTNNNASINAVTANGTLMLDFSKTAVQKTATVAGSAGGMGSGDSAKLLDLKAGQRVKAYVREVSAVGGTATVDLYLNSTDSPKFFDNVDINATAGTRYAADGSTGKTDGTASIELLVAEDCQLVILANNALAAGKIEIALEVVQLFAA